MMIVKMINKSRIKTVIGSLFLTLCFTACSLNIPYENQFSDPDAITTPNTARELLATAYKQLPSPEFDLSVLGDDFETTSWISRDASLNNLYKWQTQPIEDLAVSIWSDYYAAVAIANAVLERVDGISVSTTEETKELQAVVSEAKLLKAYCYFNLLRLFAPDYEDGPEKDGIILKDQLELEFLYRSSIEECVTAIRELLKEALPVENNSSNVYWFSQYSGYYMWAELELYAHNYEQAAEYAQKVIDEKGGYDVLGETVYATLWSNSSCAERVFSLFTNSSYYTGINYDTHKGDYMTVNSSLITLYADGDIRSGASVFTKEMTDDALGNTTMENCLGKYNKMNWEKIEPQYINKYRVAGACFILAEAYCRDGKGHDGQAVGVMNRYLEQRNATLLDAQLSGEPLLKAIFQEKWKEFVGEGERYFDLKRCRKGVLSDWNTSGAMATDKRVQADDYRWTFPIPRGEYLYNENVSQNEGWTKIEN